MPPLPSQSLFFLKIALPADRKTGGGEPVAGRGVAQLITEGSGLNEEGSNVRLAYRSFVSPSKIGDSGESIVQRISVRLTKR